MKPIGKIAIPTQVMARQVGDETVILDLASGIYFGLDPVGTRVWQLIGEGKDLQQICDILLAEYETTREQLAQDLEQLVREMSAQGLVILGSQGEPSPG